MTPEECKQKRHDRDTRKTKKRQYTMKELLKKLQLQEHQNIAGRKKMVQAAALARGIAIKEEEPLINKG